MIKQQILEWFRDNPNEESRFNFSGLKEGIVIDAGAYIGEWTERMRLSYPDCEYHLFEPVERFYKVCKEKFSDVDDVEVFQKALGSQDKSIKIQMLNDGSKMADFGEPSLMEDVDTYIRQKSISEVELLKLNIEGGEYDVIDRLAKIKQLKNIKRILVQFHNFYPNAETRLLSCREALSKTHNNVWNYDFVWEYWEKK